jgi:hypothetical protein
VKRSVIAFIVGVLCVAGCRVNKGTRAFGLIVPNFPPLNVNAPWRDFGVTVDQVETLTECDFFTNLGAMTEFLIDQRRDRL